MRGYRLQALYTLHRLLHSNEDVVFHLEGHEDLDIFDPQGEALEIIQLKAYERDLTLSILKPKKDRSFFRRVLERRGELSGVVERVVSFGPYGDDLGRAWANDPVARHDVVAQFISWGYTRDEAEYLLGAVELDRADEQVLEAEVFTWLCSTFTGYDPHAAFDLLHAWLFRLAERQERISLRDVQQKLSAIGRFLADRAAHHAEWFTSLVPLTGDSVQVGSAYEAEFYQGVSARYEHILANVDVAREDRLRSIDEAFTHAPLVVVRGASGQGKSALAYRYLHDYIPEAWRFEVRLVQDRRHALSIARALLGHLDAIGVPAYVYVDVAPGDTAWTTLVQEMQAYSTARVLVTIREEDWLRSSSDRSLLKLEEIEVRLDEQEARHIFGRLTGRQPAPHALDFNEAWERFGREGPLLEFTYLVTQHDTLESRLRGQVERMRDEVRSGHRPPGELDLLRQVAVASAYGARLNLLPLAQSLQLAEPRRSVEALEREYLVRLDVGGRLVDGLHPLRSMMLARLLTDDLFESWGEVAARSLPVMVEADLEAFLLHAFSRRGDERGSLLTAVLALVPLSYEGAGQVLRSLLWLGVCEYVERNAEVIRDAQAFFGQGWWTVLLPDLGNVNAIVPGLVRPYMEELAFLPEEHRRHMSSYRLRLTPTNVVFEHARLWLERLPGALDAPADLRAWAASAELVFWLAHLGFASRHALTLLNALAARAADLPLETVADVLYAASFVRDSEVATALEQMRPTILARFQREATVTTLEDDRRAVHAHFLFDQSLLFEPVDAASLNKPDASRNLFHEEAMWRVHFLRRLLPGREEYGSRGYGHQVGVLRSLNDDSCKAVQTRYLPPSWATELNARFHRLADFGGRPETWQSHAELILAARQQVLDNLSNWMQALNRYHRRRDNVPLLGSEGHINPSLWDAARRAAERRSSLPKVAVDEWGFISEGMASPSSRPQDPQDQIADRRSRGALALAQHKPYMKALHEYFSAFVNFLSQAQDVFMFLPYADKFGTPEMQALKESLMAQHHLTERNFDPHLPTYNFADVLAALPGLQREYRERFNNLVPATKLEPLERRERELLELAWSAWTFFVRYPTRRGLPDPQRDALKQWRDARQKVRRRIEAGFKTLWHDGIEVQILKAAVTWKGQSALWISFNVRHAPEMYTAYEQVLLALKAALPPLEGTSLGYYATKLAWPSIHLIPLVQGKGLDMRSWQLDTNTLMGSDLGELGWWNHTPQPLPEDVWGALGIQQWDHERLRWWTDAQSGLVRFAWLVGHAASLQEMPDPNEVGELLLGEYVQDQAQRMADALQAFMDALVRVCTYSTSLSEATLEQRPALIVALGHLSHLHQEWLALGMLDSGQQWNIEELARLEEPLQQSLLHLELIRLHWVQDILDSS